DAAARRVRAEGQAEPSVGPARGARSESAHAHVPRADGGAAARDQGRDGRAAAAPRHGGGGRRRPPAVRRAGRDALRLRPDGARPQGGPGQHGALRRRRAAEAQALPGEMKSDRQNRAGSRLVSGHPRSLAASPVHREFLRRHGHRTTLGYLGAVCELTLRESPLLPHVNPGLMVERDLAALREVSVSMGLMLETVAERLGSPGLAHDRAPDKAPARRLRTIALAGKLSIPFTTGILIGIGETLRERVDALAAIRDLHERYGHLQEVIIQNFRAKPRI